MNSNFSHRRRMRWWIPTLLIAAWVATAVGLHFFEVVFREHILLAVSILILLLLGAWYVLLTSLPTRRRLVLLGFGSLAVLGTAYGIKQFTRVDGSIGGSGVPKLAWKWSPSKDTRLGGLDFVAASPALEPPEEKKINQADWPQFLGPERDGIVRGVSLVPDWSSQPPRELWRTPIGLGWSAFAISGDRAVTQEQRGPAEMIVCYDRLTGSVHWAHTNLVRFSEALGGDGPRATPTLVGNQVFAIGATGILDCLDLQSGHKIWSRDVLGERGAGNLTWGKSSSPLVYDGMVVVTGGDGSGPTLLAFDAKTGEPAWAAGSDRASYASPVLATVAGRRQILSTNARSVTGHDPVDGTILWEFAWPGDFPKVAHPIALDEERVLVSAGYGIGSVLLRISPEAEGGFAAEELWRSRGLKSKFTNPVVRGEFAYGLDDGILVCLDLATGERRWKDGRFGHGQILLVNNLLLIQAESGAVALVEASPEAFREVTRFVPLRGKTWNNPSLSGDLLLVRNDQEAACYQLPVALPSPELAGPLTPDTQSSSIPTGQ